MSVSRLSVLLLFTIYFANYMSGNIISQYFSLNQHTLFANIELWRLFTYPFAMNSIYGSLLFAFTFWFLAPKFETLYKSKYYISILFLLIISNGLLITTIFRDSRLIISGTDILSFFALGFYWFRFKSTSKNYLSPKILRVGIMLMLVLISWISALSISLFYTNNFNNLIIGFSSAMTGITASVLAFYQLKIKTIYDRLNTFSTVSKPIPIHLKPELVDENKLKRNYNYQNYNEEYENEQNFETELSEDMLNSILDKMYVYGKESLSHEENQFLIEYSSKLN